MGPLKGMYFGAFLPSFLTAVVSWSKPLAGGDKKWEEPDLPEIPWVQGLFDSAWRSVDKDQARVKTGVVDLAFCFPKPMLLVNMLSPEHKKTYLVNWLSSHSLWIHQIVNNPPSKFPSPQMWRDFPNTIEGNLVSRTKSSNNKIAAHEILGKEVNESARGLSMAPTEIAWWGTQVFFFLQISIHILVYRFASQPFQTCPSSSRVAFCGNYMNSISGMNSIHPIRYWFWIPGPHLTKLASPTRHYFTAFFLEAHGQSQIYWRNQVRWVQPLTWTIFMNCCLCGLEQLTIWSSLLSRIVKRIQQNGISFFSHSILYSDGIWSFWTTTFDSLPLSVILIYTS